MFSFLKFIGSFHWYTQFNKNYLLDRRGQITMAGLSVVWMISSGKIQPFFLGVTIGSCCQESCVILCPFQCFSWLNKLDKS